MHVACWLCMLYVHSMLMHTYICKANSKILFRGDGERRGGGSGLGLLWWRSRILQYYFRPLPAVRNSRVDYRRQPTLRPTGQLMHCGAH
jgi:hypothetical protein